MRKTFTAILALGFVGCGASLSSPTPSTSILSACEEAIKGRLKAPATYSRISSTDVSQPIDTTGLAEALSEEFDYLNELETLSPEQHLRKAQILPRLIVLEQPELAEGPPMKFKLLIEYDSDNSYGVPIRSTDTCSYEAFDGDTSRADAQNVLVNGKNAHDWLISIRPF